METQAETRVRAPMRYAPMCKYTCRHCGTRVLASRMPHGNTCGECLERRL